MTTTNIQKNINDKIFDDIISYLQEQCKFYTRIINNDEELIITQCLIYYLIDIIQKMNQ